MRMRTGEGSLKGATRDNMILGRTIGACLLLAVAAGCAPRELILTGERLDLRPPQQDAAAAADRAAPISIPGPRTNADWTHVAGDAQHDPGNVSFSAAPQRIWTASIGQGENRRHRITAAPVVSGGRIFTVDSRARVMAHDTGGNALWSADLTPATDSPDDASGAGLAVSGGTLFVTTAFGDLFALDVSTGRELWSQDLDAPASGAPAVYGDLVYVVSRDARGWAIDTQTGRVEWTVQGTPGDVGVVGGSAPAVTDRTALFPFSSGEMIAALREGGYNLWTGRVMGERQGRVYARYSDLSGDPVVSGGRIYVGSSGGRTVAFEASSGERVWSVREGALGPVAAVGGSVFLLSDLGELVRLDAATGERVWGVELPLYLRERASKREKIYNHFGPLLAGSRLWVASSDGVLRAFDATDGTVVQQVALPGGAASAPAVANGVMYVVSQDGDLHAFR